ncbi:hypothetical protein B0H11DRAFT_2050185, partial [Mycena galericulata]
MLRPPGLYHRLAWALSVLYIIFSLTAIYIYGFSDADGSFRIISIVYAGITLGLLSKMIPYTTSVDEASAFSRVGKHFVLIGVLLLNWLILVIRIPIVLTGNASEIDSACKSARFLTRSCMPIGMELILTLAIFVSLFCASWTVFHRAVALHGEAEIALPPGIPHPANFFPFQMYPQGSTVPLWMLAHIADTERESEAKPSVQL